MPTPLDEPLYQTSVKLFESDVEWLKRTHGNGWTEVVRDLVRSHKRRITEKQSRGGLIELDDRPALSFDSDSGE